MSVGLAFRLRSSVESVQAGPRPWRMRFAAGRGRPDESTEAGALRALFKERSWISSGVAKSWDATVAAQVSGIMGEILCWAPGPVLPAWVEG